MLWYLNVNKIYLHLCKFGMVTIYSVQCQGQQQIHKEERTGLGRLQNWGQPLQRSLGVENEVRLRLSWPNRGLQPGKTSQVSVWLSPLLLDVLAPLNGYSFEPWDSLKLSTEMPGDSSLCPSPGKRVIGSEEGISALSIPQDTPVQFVVGAYFLAHNKCCFPKGICHLLGMIGLLKVRRFFSSLFIGCLV